MLTFQASSSHAVPLNLCSPHGQHTLDKVSFQLTLPHPLTVFINLPLEKSTNNLKLCSCHLVNLRPWVPRSELLWVKGYGLAPSLSKLCLFKVYVQHSTTTNRRTTGSRAIWEQILLRYTD